MNAGYVAGLLMVLILTPAIVKAEEALGATSDVQLVKAEVPEVAVDAQTETADDKPVEVGNKICPVSNEKVGEHGMEPVQVTHNGKVYNLCCSMCAKDFNKDPEKFAKLADDEVKADGETKQN